MEKVCICYFVSWEHFFAAVVSAMSMKFHNDSIYEINFKFHVDYISADKSIIAKDRKVLAKLFGSSFDLIEVNYDFYKNLGIDANFFGSIVNRWHPIILLKGYSVTYLKDYDWVMYCDDDIICHNSFQSLLDNQYDIITQRHGAPSVVNGYIEFYKKHILSMYPNATLFEPIVVGWIFFNKKINSEDYYKIYKTVLIDICIKKTEEQQIFFWPIKYKNGDAWTDEVLFASCNSILNLRSLSSIRNSNTHPHLWTSNSIFIHSSKSGRYKFWGSNLTSMCCQEWETYYNKYKFLGGRPSIIPVKIYPNLKHGLVFYKTLVCPSFWDNLQKNNIKLFKQLVYVEGINDNLIKFCVFNTKEQLLINIKLNDVYNFEISDISVQVVLRLSKYNMLQAEKLLIAYKQGLPKYQFEKQQNVWSFTTVFKQAEQKNVFEIIANLLLDIKKSWQNFNKKQMYYRKFFSFLFKH